MIKGDTTRATHTGRGEAGSPTGRPGASKVELSETLAIRANLASSLDGASDRPTPPPRLATPNSPAPAPDPLASVQAGRKKHFREGLLAARHVPGIDRKHVRAWNSTGHRGLDRG
jgi:hypothetical protein